MTDQQPRITLNNGVQMPALGFGVFQSAPEETALAVETALRTGYRHIDTAAAYGNERNVGEGIRASGINRDEIFIETKVWINDFGKAATRHSFEKAVGKLQVDTIDLFILHQAFTEHFDRTIEAYLALESLLTEGKVRAIGVSNFMVEQLDRLLAVTNVVPAVNQIEVHPYFQEPEVQAANIRYGIVTQAWSPIGGITFYPGWGHRDRVNVMMDPVINQIADAHSKSPAQVMLRWHLQQGRQAIPKSTNPSRIAENFDVFDFVLSAKELDAIDGLDTNLRGGPAPDDVTLADFGNEIPEA